MTRPQPMVCCGRTLTWPDDFQSRSYAICWSCAALTRLARCYREPTWWRLLARLVRVQW